MKILLSSIFLAVSWLISAQPNMHHGVIVDNHYEVIPSHFAVETTFDAVIIRSDLDTATRIVMPAHRVSSFRYFDSASNVNRHFKSLRHEGIYRFYEVVIYGELLILRRLKRNVALREADEGHDYDFFCWFRSELIELKKFKSDVFPFLVQMHRQILEEFVRQNKLRLHDAGSIFSIVKKCNELSERQRLVATR